MFLAWWNKAEIPTGWLLCDGDNGTPDLREKFVRCAYSDITRPPGDTGGEKHTHGISDASHSHSTGNHSHTHNTEPGSDWQSGSTHGAATIAHNHGASSTEEHGHTVSEEDTLPRYIELVIIGTTEDAERDEFPVGIIAMWAGSVDSIPSGWAFCDGQGGRPDLRDRFLKGAEAAGGAGGDGKGHAHDLSSAGSHWHTSAAKDFTHTHGSTGYPTTGFLRTTRTLQASELSGTHTHELSTAGYHNHDDLDQNDGHLPPFYALAFIRREA